MTVPIPENRCISLDHLDHRCSDLAKYRVSSDAGWSGDHCRTHALRVVDTMLSQVEAAGYTIHVEKNHRVWK